MAQNLLIKNQTRSVLQEIYVEVIQRLAPQDRYLVSRANLRQFEAILGFINAVTASLGNYGRLGRGGKRRSEMVRRISSFMGSQRLGGFLMRRIPVVIQHIGPRTW